MFVRLFSLFTVDRTRRNEGNVIAGENEITFAVCIPRDVIPNDGLFPNRNGFVLLHTLKRGLGDLPIDVNTGGAESPEDFHHLGNRK